MTEQRSWRISSGWMLSLLMGLVFVFSLRNLFDADVWWHLASGRWMWEHRAILRADPFSFTVFGHPWVNQEWLFEIVLYGIYQVANIPGVLIFKGLLLALSAAARYVSLPDEDSPAVRGVV